MSLESSAAAADREASSRATKRRKSALLTSQGSDIHSELLACMQASNLKRFNELLKTADSAAINSLREGSEGVKTSLLHQAVSLGQYNCVEALLEAKADVNCVNSAQGPVLDEAAYIGNVEIAKLLLSRGAKKTKRNANGANALHTACSEGKLEMVKYLISEGLDVNCVNHEGYTPLCWAIHVQDEAVCLAIMQLLVKHGAWVNLQDNQGIPPLMWAVDYCRPGVVRFLIENKADIIGSVTDEGDSPACLCFTDITGTDPKRNDRQLECRKIMYQAMLKAAVEVSALEVVNLCLRGPIPKPFLSYNPEGDRAEPLGIAAAVLEGDTSILAKLLAAKLDSSIPDLEGNMAIHCAAHAGNCSAIKLLLESKCDPNLANKTQQWTALMFACEVPDRKKQMEAVRLLLNARADLNLQDKSGNTALIWAVFKGSGPCVRLLLEQPRINIELANEFGCRASHYAAYKAHLSQEHFECLELLAGKFDGSAITDMGLTPADVSASVIEQPAPVVQQQKGRAEKKDPKKSAIEALPSRVRELLLRFGHKKTSIPEAAVPRNVYRCADVSGGLEPTPIPLVNEVDDVWKLDWKYITANIAGKGVTLPTLSPEAGCSCNCEGECSLATNCRCLQRYLDSKEGFPFAGHQIVRDEVSVLYECNELCSCAKTCCNRLVQHGVRVKFEVIRTKWKGWGVRALERIPKGTMIVEYIGEIIHEDEVMQRTKTWFQKGVNFVFSFDGSEYSIDPLKYGNVARMFNHSCEPNMVKKKVFVHHTNPTFPRVAFFSRRDIEVGEELCIDYGWTADFQTPRPCLPCRCETPTCRRLLS